MLRPVSRAIIHGRESPLVRLRSRASVRLDPRPKAYDQLVTLLLQLTVEVIDA